MGGRLGMWNVYIKWFLVILFIFNAICKGYKVGVLRSGGDVQDSPEGCMFGAIVDVIIAIILMI